MALLRGTVVSFAAGPPPTAVVRLSGSTPQSIAVNCVRWATGVIAGDRCIIDTGDHGATGDALMIAAWV